MPYRKVRPMPNEKPTRNEMILTMYREHPELTLGDIANAFDISRQRVFAIVKNMQKAKSDVGRLLRNGCGDVVAVGVAPKGANDAKSNP